MTKFCEAVGTIIEGFDIVLLSVFDLARVIINSVFKSVHLSKHQAPIWVDYRVSLVKFNCSIEVINGVLQPLKDY
jgi:hypothetical protein